MWRGWHNKPYVNRIVVVTGASAGIGEAIAMELGRRGDSLVLAARTADALERVASQAGTRTHIVTADVTRRADVERIRDEAIRAFGRVDVWINNAGKGILRPVLELTDDDLDEMIDVNVKSALYGMQAIAPHFMERGSGHIVNISSFLARVPGGAAAFGVQRGESGAQHADRQPARRPAAHASRHPRHGGHAGTCEHRLRAPRPRQHGRRCPRVRSDRP